MCASRNATYIQMKQEHQMFLHSATELKIVLERGTPYDQDGLILKNANVQIKREAIYCGTEENIEYTKRIHAMIKILMVCHGTTEESEGRL